MSGEAFRETLRRFLGLERPPPGGVCPTCGAPQSGGQVRRCGHYLTRRHHDFVECVAHLVRHDARVRDVDTETRAPFRLGALPDKTMDIVFPSHQVDLPVPNVQPSAAAAATGCPPLRGGVSVACCLDITVSDCTLQSYARVAARDVQKHLHNASAAKIRTYVASGAMNLATFTIFSLAYDQFGAASPDTHAVIRVLARRQAAHSNGRLPTAVCVTRWRQKLSMQLQRIMSDKVIWAWNKTCGTPLHPLRPGGLSEFRQLRLLRSPGPGPTAVQPLFAGLAPLRPVV
jgi:hypothetical protein